jgi:Winged helix-turn helix
MLRWPGVTTSRAGSEVMSRRRTAPLRPLTTDERAELERVSRSGSDRADRVAHAKALLAIADGALFSDAARCAGRRSPRAVAHLVARFNADRLAALDRRHGGGPAIQYGAAERERILQEFRRTPDRERDGTATWSLTTLQRALRTAPDGLPGVSTQTILQTLWDAGYTWQQNRTWCKTGTVIRKRKAGPVEVTDPDTAPKKS